MFEYSEHSGFGGFFFILIGKAVGDNQLMNKFIRPNFGGGLTLKTFIHENPHRAFFGSPLEAKLLWTLTLRQLKF